MLPTKSGRSYSDFFTSGFRAMMSRSSRRSMPSPFPTENDPLPQPTSTPKSSRRHSKLIDFAKRHSRPTSMILSSSISFQTTSPSLSTPSRERHKRCSSIISFPNRIFDRKAATTDSSLSFSSSPSKNTRELLNSTEIMEVWITAGGPYTPKSHEDSIVFQSIDPFASSPDSKSFFTDWSESPAPSNQSSKGHRESFLSLSGSSSDRSFLRLPSIRVRERPTSVQTMPLPATSRRSSYIAFPPSRDSWILGEQVLEEEDLETWQGPGLVENIVEEQLDLDPTQNIDWRQFHLDVLPHEA
ncbi:hypothetical protein H2248_008823 [Termitomyces sp. 'cryptogamus']|nr:hypothetical protein H2248_008823 [Termitomyces sp. 'cryptogamus']